LYKPLNAVVRYYVVIAKPIYGISSNRRGRHWLRDIGGKNP
jgi:hypothetical protein